MDNQKAKVLFNNIPAGVLFKENGKYYFKYEKSYLDDSGLPAISLTLPKQEEMFTSDYLFPFFFGMLSEGEEKITKCRVLKIDENDSFSLLLKTGGNDTIGAIRVVEI